MPARTRPSWGSPGRPATAHGVRIPAGPSRTLAVTYRTHLADAAPAATVAVRETVVGAVGLTAPKLARFGRPLLMHGALAGGFIPSGGTLVGMQIFFSGHWRTIDLVRTDAAGRFAYDYVLPASRPGPGASAPSCPRRRPIRSPRARAGRSRCWRAPAVRALGAAPAPLTRHAAPSCGARA